jgi:cytochrome c553
VIPVNVLARIDGSNVEKLGRRIIEIPVDTRRTELRDSQAAYIAYVPLGSLERGKALTQMPPGTTPAACATCHGAGLKGGLGDIPALAGRSPSYLFRQLYDIQHGTRTGPSVEPMKAVVQGLTDDEMLELAAYLASLKSR